MSLSRKLRETKESFFPTQSGYIIIAGEPFMLSVEGSTNSIGSKLYHSAMKGEDAFQLLYLGGLPKTGKNSKQNFTKEEQKKLRDIYRSVFRVTATKTAGSISLPCDEGDLNLLTQSLMYRAQLLRQEIINYDAGLGSTGVVNMERAQLQDHLEKLTQLIEREIPGSTAPCADTGPYDPNSPRRVPGLDDTRMLRLLEIFAYLLAQGKDPLKIFRDSIPDATDILGRFGGPDAPILRNYEDEYEKEKGEKPKLSRTLIKIKRVLTDDPELLKKFDSSEFSAVLKDLEDKLGISPKLEIKDRQADLVAAIDTLQTNLGKCESEKTTLEKKIGELEAEKAQCEADKLLLENKSKDPNFVTLAKADHDKLKADLTAAQGALATMQAALAAAQADAATKLAERDAARRELATAQAALAAEQATLVGVRRDLAEAHTTIARLRGIPGAGGPGAAAGAGVDAARLQAEIIRLEQEEQRLLTEIARHDALVQQVTQTVRNKEAENAALTRTVTEHETTIHDLLQQIQASDTLIQRVITSLERKEAEVSTLTEQIRQRDVRIAELTAAAAPLAAQLADLQRQLAEAQRDLAASRAGPGGSGAGAGAGAGGPGAEAGPQNDLEQKRLLEQIARYDALVQQLQVGVAAAADLQRDLDAARANLATAQRDLATCRAAAAAGSGAGGSGAGGSGAGGSGAGAGPAAVPQNDAEEQRLLEQIARYDALVQQLQAQVAATEGLQNDLDAARRELAALRVSTDSEEQRLLTEISHYDTLIQRVEARATSIEAERARLDGENRELRKQNLDIVVRIGRLRLRMGELERERVVGVPPAQLRAEIAFLDEQIATLLEEIQHYDTLLQRTLSTINQLEARVDSLREQLVFFEQQITRLLDTQAQSDALIQRLIASNEELERELARCTEDKRYLRALIRTIWDGINRFITEKAATFDLRAPFPQLTDGNLDAREDVGTRLTTFLSELQLRPVPPPPPPAAAEPDVNALCMLNTLYFILISQLPSSVPALLDGMAAAIRPDLINSILSVFFNIVIHIRNGTALTITPEQRNHIRIALLDTNGPAIALLPHVGTIKTVFKTFARNPDFFKYKLDGTRGAEEDGEFTKVVVLFLSLLRIKLVQHRDLLARNGCPLTEANPVARQSEDEMWAAAKPQICAEWQALRYRGSSVRMDNVAAQEAYLNRFDAPGIQKILEECSRPEIEGGLGGGYNPDLSGLDGLCQQWRDVGQRGKIIRDQKLSIYQKLYLDKQCALQAVVPFRPVGLLGRAYGGGKTYKAKKRKSALATRKRR